MLLDVYLMSFSTINVCNYITHICFQHNVSLCPFFTLYIHNTYRYFSLLGQVKQASVTDFVPCFQRCCLLYLSAQVPSVRICGWMHPMITNCRARAFFDLLLFGYIFKPHSFHNFNFDFVLSYDKKISPLRQKCDNIYVLLFISSTLLFGPFVLVSKDGLSASRYRLYVAVFHFDNW